MPPAPAAASKQAANAAEEDAAINVRLLTHVPTLIKNKPALLKAVAHRCMGCLAARRAEPAARMGAGTSTAGGSAPASRTHRGSSCAASSVLHAAPARPPARRAHTPTPPAPHASRARQLPGRHRGGAEQQPGGHTDGAGGVLTGNGQPGAAGVPRTSGRHLRRGCRRPQAVKGPAAWAERRRRPRPCSCGRSFSGSGPERCKGRRGACGTKASRLTDRGPSPPRRAAAAEPPAGGQRGQRARASGLRRQAGRAGGADTAGARGGWDGSGLAMADGAPWWRAQQRRQARGP
jgi:hypothetical protein